MRSSIREGVLRNILGGGVGCGLCVSLADKGPPDSLLSPWRALLGASPGARHSPELGTWPWVELPQPSLALYGFKALGSGATVRVWGGVGLPALPVSGAGCVAVSSAQILPLPAGPFQLRAGFCRKPAQPAPPAASLGLWQVQALRQVLGGDWGQGQGLVAP